MRHLMQSVLVSFYITLALATPTVPRRGRADRVTEFDRELLKLLAGPCRGVLADLAILVVPGPALEIHRQVALAREPHIMLLPHQATIAVFVCRFPDFDFSRKHLDDRHVCHVPWPFRKDIEIRIHIRRGQPCRDGTHGNHQLVSRHQFQI